MALRGGGRKRKRGPAGLADFTALADDAARTFLNQKSHDGGATWEDTPTQGIIGKPRPPGEFAQSEFTPPPEADPARADEHKKQEDRP